MVAIVASSLLKGKGMDSIASNIQQLPLFPMDNLGPPQDALDPLTLFRNGATLVLSVSGGKDSNTKHSLNFLNR